MICSLKEGNKVPPISTAMPKQKKALHSNEGSIVKAVLKRGVVDTASATIRVRFRGRFEGPTGAAKRSKI